MLEWRVGDNLQTKENMLRKQITRISPLQTAKVFALLYFILSLPLLGLMSLSFLSSPAPQPSMMFLMMVPFAYLVCGFIFTAIGAFAYNLVAQWVGGVEYTTVELP